MVISVKELTAVFFCEGIAFVEGFVLDVVLLLEWGFSNTMVLDARILITRSMFFSMGSCGDWLWHILWISQYLLW